jgi:surface protein
LTVEQWGTGLWRSMEGSFSGATNLTIPASDAPDLSAASSTGIMFLNATSLNQSLNNWDVSNITQMSGMFFGASGFNQSLNAWDVSNVTNMLNMFRGASSFNQPLNSWDVSSVQSMQFMFYGASDFNQPLADWDVSSLVTANSMFYDASSFDQSLASWDVTTVNTTAMFVNSGLGVANYSATLAGWGNLSSLVDGINLGTVGLTVSPTPHYSTSQAARDTLTTTYNWTITDGGSLPAFSVSYAAGVNATLIGVGTQVVASGSDATSVEVVPDSGFVFVKWSDDVTDNPRTDIGIGADITVTAVVESVPEEPEEEPVEENNSTATLVTRRTGDSVLDSDHSLSGVNILSITAEELARLPKETQEQALALLSEIARVLQLIAESFEGS